MKEKYLKVILAIERLHRRFLDVVKNKLDSLGIEDINNVQTLILYNIGKETISIGELTNRGYYLGSNVSYNIKKMVDSGFLEQERSSHDKRSIKVAVTEKGLKLIAQMDELVQKNVAEMPNFHFNEQNVTVMLDQLNTLEDFWTHLLVTSSR